MVNGPYRITARQQAAALQDLAKLKAKLLQVITDRSSGVGPPPHIAREWSRLSTDQQFEVLDWAARKLRAEAHPALRSSRT